MLQDFDASCLGGMLTASAKEAETCIQKNAPTRFLQLRDQVQLLCLMTHTCHITVIASLN